MELVPSWISMNCLPVSFIVSILLGAGWGWLWKFVNLWPKLQALVLINLSEIISEKKLNRLHISASFWKRGQSTGPASVACYKVGHSDHWLAVSEETSPLKMWALVVPLLIKRNSQLRSKWIPSLEFWMKAYLPCWSTVCVCVCVCARVHGCVFLLSSLMNYISHSTLGLVSPRTRTWAFGGHSGFLTTPPSCTEPEWWPLRFPNPADTAWGSKEFGSLNNYTLRMPAVC